MQGQIDNMVHGGCVKSVTTAMYSVDEARQCTGERRPVRSGSALDYIGDSPMQLDAATSPRSAGPDDAC